MAGAIAWAHALFLRMKQAMVAFEESGDLKTRELYAEVREKYKKVGRDIRKYENFQYSTWEKSALAACDVWLEYNILARAGDHDYTVNFAPALAELIAETKGMDALGRAVHKKLLNVALQEDKLTEYVSALSEVLDRYRGVLAKLSPVERDLLSRTADDIPAVAAALEKGLELLNWKSLGINDFIEGALEAINRFDFRVIAMQRSAKVCCLVIRVFVVPLMLCRCRFNHLLVPRSLACFSPPAPFSKPRATVLGD